MSGPQRNPDKVNTIGIVVIGICGAVLVYVSIVALQAFYMSDTAEPNTVAAYSGQDIAALSLRSEEISSISAWQYNNSVDLQGKNTARISIDAAMKLVVDETTKSPTAAKELVPALGPSNVPLIQARYGRPIMAPPPSPAPAAGSGSAAGSAEAPDAGSGSAAAGSAAAGSAAAGSSAAGSAAAGPGSRSAPTTPTGGLGQGGGNAPGSATAGSGSSE